MTAAASSGLVARACGASLASLVALIWRSHWKCCSLKEGSRTKRAPGSSPVLQPGAAPRPDHCAARALRDDIICENNIVLFLARLELREIRYHYADNIVTDYNTEHF